MRSQFLSVVGAQTTKKASEWWEKLVRGYSFSLSMSEKHFSLQTLAKLLNCFGSLLFIRKDHWDSHPRFWHRNPHDSHRWHGTWPQANPQPASCGCPHCQLPPQLQRQLIGMTQAASTETNKLSWSCVRSAFLDFTSPKLPMMAFSLVLEGAEALHATASASDVAVLSFEWTRLAEA